MKNEIIKHIEKELNSKIVSSKSVGGGCINDARTITTSDDRKYFLKLNFRSAKDMFFKEAKWTEKNLKKPTQ